MRGPQCTSLLLGRKDLIEVAARAPKIIHRIQMQLVRGTTVAKEEIIGRVAAVAWFPWPRMMPP